MIDTLLSCKGKAEQLNMAKRMGLTPYSYGTITRHRPSNVDDPAILENLLKTLSETARKLPLVSPLYPWKPESIQDCLMKRALIKGDGTAQKIVQQRFILLVEFKTKNWNNQYHGRIYFYIGGLLTLVGLSPCVRFLYFYLSGDGDGHIQPLHFWGIF